MTREETLHVLRNCPLFADFSEQALDALYPFLGFIDGDPGSRLFGETDAGDGLFVVIDGTCAAKVADESGRERLVRNIGPAGSFGELSLLLRAGRMVSVDAVNHVRLATIDVAAFRRLKRENPELCLLLTMSIVRRFGRVIDDSRDVLKRVLLCGLAGQDI